MLTGSMSISEGDAYLNGNSISKDIEKVHQDIGYCPQSDAIFPLLTAREHIIFYGRVRGIPEKYVERVCKWALKRVGLDLFEDSIAGDFSGGNKRKLSTAIALAGNPACIYLDEPTSGMDAKVRRLLWKDISNLIKDERIVILTSHNMDECEALCTRLVIMVNGKFKCLGSPQHLKNKFGTGYKVSLRLDEHNDQNRKKLQEFMKANFPAQLSTSCINKYLFEFTIPFKDTKLSSLFKLIEENRYVFGLKDYSITQSTLDSIFVNFACEQYNDYTVVDEKFNKRTTEKTFVLEDEVG
jgi:ABC-type multidrug transport system ATPase subunit